MDQLLLPYLRAKDESERQERLDELLLIDAAPLIRHTLREKLGYHVDQRGANASNQDAEDLYQEVLTKIIQRLNDLRDSNGGAEIEEFRRYVSRTAVNACIDRLRAKRPARRHLKDNIRLLLNKHPDFAISEVGGEFHCGFAAWNGTKRLLEPLPERLRIEEKLGEFRSTRFAREDITQAPRSRIIAELFDWIGSTLELDRLVSIMATLLKIDEHLAESMDDNVQPKLPPPLVRSVPAAVLRVEDQDLLRWLWHAVKGFPPEQRDAFCFRFHDGRGSDFFSVMIEYDVASWAELARVFGRSAQQLRHLRSQMPMDGLTAAAQLNTSKSNVGKWRFRAARRLEKELCLVVKKKIILEPGISDSKSRLR